MPTFFTTKDNHIVVNITGKYYIGDPCYCFSHDTKTWDDLCGSWFNGDDSNLAVTESGVEVVGIYTAYGDGNYAGTVNYYMYYFPVDAGMLGVVPASMIESDCTYNNDNSCGKIVELCAGDIIYGENGDFFISGSINVVIKTNDPYEDDDGYENDEYEHDDY